MPSLTTVSPHRRTVTGTPVVPARSGAARRTCRFRAYGLLTLPGALPHVLPGRCPVGPGPSRKAGHGEGRRGAGDLRPGSGFVDLGDDATAEFPLDEVHAGQVHADRLCRGAVALRLGGEVALRLGGQRAWRRGFRRRRAGDLDRRGSLRAQLIRAAMVAARNSRVLPSWTADIALIRKVTPSRELSTAMRSRS